MYTSNTLDWTTGLSTTICTGVRSCLRIIDDNPSDPSATLRLFKKYQVTWTFQMPSHMTQMVNCSEFKGDCMESIKYYFYGGSVTSLELKETFRRHLSSKAKLIFVYGFSELCGAIIWNWHHDEKPNSVGRLWNGIKLKIVNEQGLSLGPNEVGEVCIYTGRYWAGYYGNPEATRKMRDNNMWYHPSDMGYVDEDGFLYIVDRKSNMLKNLGCLYYPQEIEDIISQMPEVSEVCVFGIVNSLTDDEAAAAVVKKRGAQLDPQDVIDFVAKHVKAKYKQLTGGVFIVDDLKRTANGKLDRRSTKSYCIDKLKIT